jgi:aminopeptidase N
MPTLILWPAMLAVLSSPLLVEEPTRFAADRPVDVEHIRLELRVDVEARTVAGSAVIDVTALRPVTTIAFDANDLQVSAVHVARGDDSAATRFNNDGKRLEVLLASPTTEGERVKMTIAYRVEDPTTGLHFYGPTADEPDVPWVVWSQGQSVNNSYWFPCFDHPNDRQTSELIVTTKSGLEVSSNGRLISRKENSEDGTVTVHWMQDKPHVAYLISLIVGEFEIVRDQWGSLPLEYWVHPQYVEQVERSFQNTKPMLEFFSESIGIRYPWDRYAQICCHGYGGGMENTAATTLGNRTLYDERAYLDGNADGLIAHELAHQWWGDLLTCRDWAHLWLNEGFATYFEALWAEHHEGADAFAYNMRRKAARAKRGGRERPIVDRAYPSPGSMFDSRAYPKGAWVLHMIRRRLGDTLFWRTLQIYGTRNAYKTVETVDLRKTVEEVSGRSFERFFYDWTERPGHPEVTVTTKWQAEDQLVRISVKQTQDAAAFHFPLTFELRFDELPAVRFTRDITAKEVVFFQALEAAPSMVRVDPDMAVLMELSERKGRDLWVAQLREDPCANARISAAEHFGESRSIADHRELAEALQSEPFWAVQGAVAAALEEVGGDLARTALVGGIQAKDPKARRACIEGLANYHEDKIVIEALRAVVTQGDASYRVEAEAIAAYAAVGASDALAILQPVLQRDSRREVLRNAALRGLGRINDPGVIAVLCEWTRPNKPRYCRPVALGALAAATRRMNISDDDYETIIDVLRSNLDDTGSRVRGAAVSALGSIAEPRRARPAVSQLEFIAAHDKSRRTRRSAQRTLEAIAAGRPAKLQVDDLRGDVKAIQESEKDINERIDRLEELIKRQSSTPLPQDSEKGTKSEVDNGKS